MFKVLAFLTKRKDMKRQAFIEYYENHHVSLILSLAPHPVVYKRNYLEKGDEIEQDGVINFDAVTELVFPDRATYLAWGAKVGKQAAIDEMNFLDRSQTKSFIVEEHVTSR
jgi:EthD domain